MKSATYTKKVLAMAENNQENSIKTVPCLWADYPNAFNWDDISNNINRLSEKFYFAYQKIDSKVKKIDRLKENELLQAYIRINKEIKKGRWSFNLDNLHNSYIACIDNINNIELKDNDKNRVYKYLVKACYNRSINEYTGDNNFQLLKDNHSQLVVENKENGVTNSYIGQVISAIKKKLKGSQYEIFDLKYIKGYTFKEVSKLTGIELTKVKRELKSIDLKIFSLKVEYFIDKKYELYQSKKKRKYVRYDDYQESSGICFKRSIENYEPIKDNPLDIPIDKVMSYPTLQWYKLPNFEGIDYAIKDKVTHISNNLYSYKYDKNKPLYLQKKSISTMDKKSKRLSSYRIKKLNRNYKGIDNQDNIKRDKALYHKYGYGNISQYENDMK